MPKLQTNGAKQKRTTYMILLLWAAVCFALLVVDWCCWAPNRLDADMASEQLLANLLAQEGGVMSTNWYYSTELRVLNTQLVMAPLFRLFTSWHTVRVVGSVVLILLYLAAWFWFERSAKLKYSGLLGAGLLVLALLGLNHCLPDGLALPGVGYCTLGPLAPVVWLAILVALAESARTADGMDGTVCGCAFIAMLGLMTAMTLLGWFPLGVLPAALAGALMAFLLWNFYPAKLRPGAVGCQFLAGALGCVPLSVGWPGLTLPLALPYWLEGGMVALQIIVWKASGGRRQLFGTAPLHRWLEKRGFDPVNIFYIFGVLAMLGLALTLQAARAS